MSFLDFLVTDLGTQPMIQYIITHLAIPLSKQNVQPGTLLETLLTGRISLHHCPSRLSQKGSVGLLVYCWGVPASHGELSTRPEVFSSSVH